MALAKQRGFAFPAFLLNPKLLAALAVAALTAAALWYTYRLGGDAPREQIKARERADAVEYSRQLRNKERTDEESERRAVATAAELDRLRKLPKWEPGPAPAQTRCPDDQVCYDRAEFTAATRSQREEVRSIVGEGAKVADLLQDAQEWSRGD